MVSVQTNMQWDPVALAKYNKLLNLIPIFHRRLAQEVVNKKAEQAALARSSSTVEESDIVQAFVTEVPLLTPYWMAPLSRTLSQSAALLSCGQQNGGPQ